ncbi:hypothetical protein FBU30_008418 [Linnemannia zychae]|nr:hypothetical protein FBU30_008418 [Linnemannia zychae]
MTAVSPSSGMKSTSIKIEKLTISTPCKAKLLSPEMVVIYNGLRLITPVLFKALPSYHSHPVLDSGIFNIVLMKISSHCIVKTYRIRKWLFWKQVFQQKVAWEFRDTLSIVETKSRIREINESAGRMKSNPQLENFVSLKKLDIYCDSIDQPFNDCLNKLVISRCVNLECIRIENLGTKSLISFARVIRDSCPNLVQLDYLSEFEEDGEAAIVEILRMSRLGWRYVDLLSVDNFNRTASAELFSHAPTLEVLKVIKWPEYDMEDLCSFLRHAKNLRILEGNDDRMSVYAGLRLDANFMVTQSNNRHYPWGLGKAVEFFQLQIDNIPRPDVIYQQNGEPLQAEIPNGNILSDPSSRYEVQRWILTQLGSMTGLKVLILGLPEPDIYFPGFSELDELDDFNYSSLEFSLASGLDLLAGLKELRVLNVSCTAHRIGVKELEWMYVHWPKLEKIKGLESKREWAEDIEAGLAAKRAVDEWMMAHPKGIGSLHYTQS